MTDHPFGNYDAWKLAPPPCLEDDVDEEAAEAARDFAMDHRFECEREEGLR